MDDESGESMEPMEEVPLTEKKSEIVKKIKKTETEHTLWATEGGLTALVFWRYSNNVFTVTCRQ